MSVGSIVGLAVLGLVLLVLLLALRSMLNIVQQGYVGVVSLSLSYRAQRIRPSGNQSFADSLPDQAVSWRLSPVARSKVPRFVSPGGPWVTRQARLPGEQGPSDASGAMEPSSR